MGSIDKRLDKIMGYDAQCKGCKKKYTADQMQDLVRNDKKGRPYHECYVCSSTDFWPMEREDI